MIDRGAVTGSERLNAAEDDDTLKTQLCNIAVDV
jgi:hypothetical protein